MTVEVWCEVTGSKLTKDHDIFVNVKEVLMDTNKKEMCIIQDNNGKEIRDYMYKIQLFHIMIEDMSIEEATRVVGARNINPKSRFNNTPS